MILLFIIKMYTLIHCYTNIIKNNITFTKVIYIYNMSIYLCVNKVGYIYNTIIHIRLGIPTHIPAPIDIFKYVYNIINAYIYI